MFVRRSVSTASPLRQYASEVQQAKPSSLHNRDRQAGVVHFALSGENDKGGSRVGIALEYHSLVRGDAEKSLELWESQQICTPPCDDKPTLP